MSTENVGAGAQAEGSQRGYPPLPPGGYPSYPPSYPAPGGMPYGYPQPYAYYPPPMSVQLSSWAIASLVCGVVGIATLNIIAAGLGAIFGHVALREIKDSNGWREGRSMALAGTIVGYVALGLALMVFAFYILYLIFIFSFLQSIPNTSPNDFIGHLLNALQLLH